ncbi:hypothetical protein CAEBREN_09564 [Caenorhabditis brenneri]|uniref:Serpentine receptor class gamma n=1 Tax=Caenorhabditis brenneri TaxID=135651 RepID=G0NSX3_CAEBE|nr:hypothetical protein CAEBREN_09564 [Caenorhabditis brenneri]
MNILCWINAWPTKLAYHPEGDVLMPFLREHVLFVIKATVFLVTYFFHIQSMNTILICTHRLTTTIFENSNKFWNRYYLLVHLAIVLLSYAVTQFFHFAGGYFNNDTKKFIVLPLSSEQHQFNAHYMWFFMIFYFSVILVLGIFTYRQLKKRIADRDQHKELLVRFTKITIVHTALYGCFLVWLGCRMYFQLQNLDLMLTFSDMVTFSMAYILIIFDKNIARSLNYRLSERSTQVNNHPTIT